MSEPPHSSSATFLPVDRMRERVRIDREDSDVAAFFSLLYFGEFVTKLVVLGLVSALPDDRDRTRYARSHRLVRADSIGDWVTVADDVLVGPASVHLSAAARDDQHALTQRFPMGAWQHDCVNRLGDCLGAMGVEPPLRTGKLAARYWFSDFAFFRNKTRGHAAPRGKQCADACSALHESIELMASNTSVLKRPWAYLRQNLSGKYRVSALGEDASAFDHLKRKTDRRYSTGMYIAFGNDIHRVDLIESDVDLSDFLLANGSFNGKTYELLSYITNSRARADATPYSVPAGTLPQSHTQGTPSIDIVNDCWTNVPPQSSGYVQAHPA